VLIRRILFNFNKPAEKIIYLVMPSILFYFFISSELNSLKIDHIVLPLRSPPVVCFWLVVMCYLMFSSRPRPRHIFSIINFCRSFRWPNDGTASAPHASPRSPLLSKTLTTVDADFWLVVVSFHQHCHVRSMIHPSLSFFHRSISPPK
jgi:hypothetical protein